MDAFISCNEAHLEALASLLARAFFDDPLYCYAFPDASLRRARAAWDLGKLALYGMHFGQVLASPALSGCVVALPPGETDFSEERMGLVGMLDAAAHIGLEGEKRLMTFVNETERYHAEVAPQPHWYLLLLGVDPAAQRQGIGSALLKAILVQADTGGFPVYLETTKAGNLPFYQRHGFIVRAEAPLPDGGVDVWYMVR
ncbi:MAG: GNAT family N-acetyltransferase [Anaerolineales bacterium]|nr:GNAT family N-acetyltransferase [Anaerolineales bacterium]